ncbi:uncharacterized protein J8A68_002138 [[Candida] subhashii]|uniref:Hyphally-regulated cell wall protein N-terminal domain-containing protein n=1 Tax=[Candida] subhashii TaxID=561895 RepID=A0A8J5QE06_9ASCO|nr:uncharacterized protein J8A68_002138 [[Candida] subhashii]KAG7664319.1 hypothetical protein J8A68_002138 [[Candida] subhashii]
MFNYLSLFVPLLLLDSSVVSTEVIPRGEETQIQENYYVSDAMSLLDVYTDYVDINRIRVFDGGQFFYVSTIPGIHMATSFNISELANLSNQGICYFDLSASESRFQSAYINRIINIGTMVFKDFHTTCPMKVDDLHNGANGSTYIENTNLKVIEQFSNLGTICLGPKLSLAVENGAPIKTTKGWIKLSPGNIVTVPGDISSNFCFPQENGYLEITSSSGSDTITLTNFFGQSNKIFLIDSENYSSKGSLVYTDPYLKITLDGKSVYRFNIGKGYASQRFVMIHIDGGYEIFYDYHVDKPSPCPCDCTMPTYSN